MSRDCVYIDRNTDWREKAVKRQSTGVKFCQRGTGVRLRLVSAGETPPVQPAGRRRYFAI
jgi:hypothetical protein